jgi:hypothetical protein
MRLYGDEEAVSDDATTARRKAMAEAIRAKFDEIFARPDWPRLGPWDELSEAADVAAEALRKEVP